MELAGVGFIIQVQRARKVRGEKPAPAPFLATSCATEDCQDLLLLCYPHLHMPR